MTTVEPTRADLVNAGGRDATARENRERILAAPPTRQSPWSTRQKFQRVMWAIAGRPCWCLLPWVRSALLRAFGASVGPGCRFDRTVQIAIPWNLRIGSNVRIGPRVVLYALGPITIDDDVIIDYRAHLCAGSHDITEPGFPQTRPPISIGRGSFIGADAYIGPGVALGARCIVHPRASVYKNFPDDMELRGNPAQPMT